MVHASEPGPAGFVSMTLRDEEGCYDTRHMVCWFLTPPLKYTKNYYRNCQNLFLEINSLSPEEFMTLVDFFRTVMRFIFVALVGSLLI